MEFRKDINALRAIAVIAVVLFHFDNNLVPGGFAGVDVFFVISGYLMTKIICDRLNNESFSIYGFYKARARRIVPALAITCLMTLVLGWLFIAPGQYLEMGKDSLSSMLFISNFLYYLRSGYFDDSSTNNFLLHTWSLSVEWQFYVIYPLVLLFVKKLLGLRFLPHAITFMALTSFASGLYGTYIYSDLAYFMFPSRAWAMLAGGVLYYIPAKAISPKIFFIGIIALGYSFFAFSKFTPWPGVGAVIPVLGAVLYIASKKDNIVLNNKITQFIGTISYEVYLTHWPVLVLIRKLNSDMSLISYTAIIIIISLALYSVCKVKNYSTIIKTGAYSATIMLALFVTYNKGIADRVPEPYRLSKGEFQKQFFGGSGYPSNTIFNINNKNGLPDLIIAGDSFGHQYSKSLAHSGVNAIALFDHGCLIFPNYSRYLNNVEDLSCSEEYEKLKMVMAEHKNTPVVLASSWDTYNGILIKKGGSNPIPSDVDNYQNIIEKEIRQIIKDGGRDRNYYIIGRPVSTNIDGFNCIAGSSLPGYRLISKCPASQKLKDADINKHLKERLSSDNVIFINPNDAICNNNECAIIKNSQPLYTDGSHLSVYGSDIVVNYLLKKIL